MEPIETITILYYGIAHSPEKKELTEGDPVLRARDEAY